MMHPVPRLDTTGANPVSGRVRWDAAKIAWFGGHGLIALVAFTAVALMGPDIGLLAGVALLTWTLVLLGHSVGYHRLLMHGNFKTGRGLGRVLIWCGVLLGATGPSRIIEVHDIRDWAQRYKADGKVCHPYFSQHGPFWRDLAWQMFARLELDHPPRHLPDPVWADDPFVRHLDRWWRVHALLPAIPLAWLGGWEWAALGVSARIVAVNAGHWAVNHLCHHPAREVRNWRVPAHGVQASDLLRASPVTGFLAGLVTAGECWHANHHAFPESANVGLGRHQFDPGYALLKLWERRGWVWDVREPRVADGDVDVVAQAAAAR